MSGGSITQKAAHKGDEAFKSLHNSYVASCISPASRMLELPHPSTHGSCSNKLIERWNCAENRATALDGGLWGGSAGSLSKVPRLRACRNTK